MFTTALLPIRRKRIWCCGCRQKGIRWDPYVEPYPPGRYGPSGTVRDIQAAQNAVCKLLNTDSCWLRPPYGLIDPAVRIGVTVPMVHWSVDPRDWESRDTAMVVRSVLKDVQPGDIILLHDIYPSSVEAALQIVDALEAEGYWFVTVEELLELNGIQPQAGAMYRSGRV